MFSFLILYSADPADVSQVCPRKIIVVMSTRQKRIGIDSKEVKVSSPKKRKQFFCQTCMRPVANTAETPASSNTSEYNTRVPGS